MKKQFYIFALVVFLLSSCKENEVIVNEISQETEQQINNIISVLKTNNSVVSQI